MKLLICGGPKGLCIEVDNTIINHKFLDPFGFSTLENEHKSCANVIRLRIDGKVDRSSYWDVLTEGTLANERLTGEEMTWCDQQVDLANFLLSVKSSG